MPTMVRQLRYNLHIDLLETYSVGFGGGGADVVAADNDDVVFENQDQEQNQEDQEPSSHLP
jgi:hypothetical protein